MAAIGDGWVDGAWIEASWVDGAWFKAAGAGAGTGQWLPLLGVGQWLLIAVTGLMG